jgi:hypothetical protein
MSLTANFDYCVELGLASTKQIFHLAFKSEERYPHNIGPFTRTLSGHDVTVEVRVLDDETDAAELRFADPKHIAFSFPFEITVTTPDAPDPSLSRVTLKARVEVPGALEAWEEDGIPTLGLSFFDITSGAVTIQSLEGLPTIDASAFAAAVHSRYDALPHVYSLGDNTLVLYDGNRDPSLDPPNAATPHDITVSVETHDATDYVKCVIPLHVTVPIPSFNTTYESFGRVNFWRAIEHTESTVSVDMTLEPTSASLVTTVELDTAHPARSLVIANLTPLVRTQLSAFGVITEPAFSDAGARALLADEVANYLSTRRYPVYTPDSGDPDHPLADPVGFLLVDAGVLAILMNRRDDSVADFAPDDFLGAGELALAVGRAKVDEEIAKAITAEFGSLPHEVNTEEGSATLTALSVVPSNAGEHDVGVGHLWTTGQAEVHIDCWPDPDVSFAGPIFVDATLGEEEGECTLTLSARAGDFDIDESCCDVFLDILIPIVGWIMLAIVESTIDRVGGQLVSDITSSQGDIVSPIPKTVTGIAEVSACLTGLDITSGGFILPGEISIRRLSESFEDRAADRDLPRP